MKAAAAQRRLMIRKMRHLSSMLASDAEKSLSHCHWTAIEIVHQVSFRSNPSPYRLDIGDSKFPDSKHSSSKSRAPARFFQLCPRKIREPTRHEKSRPTHRKIRDLISSPSLQGSEHPTRSRSK